MYGNLIIFYDRLNSTFRGRHFCIHQRVMVVKESESERESKTESIVESIQVHGLFAHEDWHANDHIVTTMLTVESHVINIGNRWAL